MHTSPDGKLRAAYVPLEMQLMMMTAFHDHLGHQGEDRMMQLLRSRYYWPGMRTDVRAYVSQCHECTLSKAPPRHNHASRTPTIGSYPFDLVYCDVADMAKTHDYDAIKKTGYAKVVIFIDSLSHWVEAVPFHTDPTSSDILDAFMTAVVSRHGVPRGIASDLGSNLSSRLCKTIQEQTGVDLTFSPSDHHESAGLVERFIQTITGMARTTDEGGSLWVTHLPFLLMSYRATPTRVTRMSPAELLYGRQLRLPAQLSSTEAPAGADLPTEIQLYAKKLNGRLRGAWEAARDAVHRSQVENASETTRRSYVQLFKENDRVCRLLPPADVGNKLQYLYAGPYRIAEVLSEGRYRLKDLENKLMSDVFDASQLRPYRSEVDAEELQPDEYLVDELMGHRGDGPNRTFQVKWRGYARAQATWEPRAELMRRCEELVEAYEAQLTLPPPRPRRVRTAPMGELLTSTGAAAPATVARSPDNYESDNVPSTARFVRGRWEYGRVIATPRGRSLRWFQSSAFTAGELDNAHFSQLRLTATAGQAAMVNLIQWELNN